jgi:site-specific DNA recombinase
MFGKTRHGHAYYSCYPAGNNADRLDRYPAEHPKAVYVREDSLTEALDHVIATRVFGPDRAGFLRQALAERPSRQRHADATRAEALRDQIDDLAARQDRLITELETTDPADRAFRDRLRRRFDTLEAERDDKNRQLAELEKTLTSQPEPDLDLLDALPILVGVTITDAPERLQRKLYDALQLKIDYDRPDQARFRLTLTDDTVNALTLATTGTVAPEPATRAHATATPPGAPS